MNKRILAVNNTRAKQQSREIMFLLHIEFKTNS